MRACGAGEISLYIPWYGVGNAGVGFSAGGGTGEKRLIKLGKGAILGEVNFAHEDDDLSIGSIDFESDNSLLGMDG